MTHRIAIFYHALTHLGNPPVLQENAVNIINEQMYQLEVSGLLEACSEFVVGLNGGAESLEIANVLIPAKAQIVLHGLESRSENLTLVLMEEFAKHNPGWLMFYHHAKCCTHDPESAYGKKTTAWRRCMEKQCVTNWRTAVSYMNQGYEACGVHWRTGIGPDRSQHYFAGTFFWVTTRFFATLPSLYTRARIKQDGIAALSSRYEAEVVLGNGPRLPRVKDLDTSHGFFQCHRANMNRQVPVRR